MTLLIKVKFNHRLLNVINFCNISMQWATQFTFDLLIIVTGFISDVI